MEEARAREGVTVLNWVMTQTLPENKGTAGEVEASCCEQVESKLEMLVFTVFFFFLNVAPCSPGCSQTQYIAEDDFVAFPF